MSTPQTWRQPFERQFKLKHRTAKYATISNSWRMTWETVAHQEDSNEYAAELLAIRQALRILVWQQQEDLPKEVTICTDCQSAILSIQNPHHQSGQHFIRVI